MRNLHTIILLLTIISCKKSDESKVNQDSSSSTKVSTVISKTGRIWMDRNLGASRVATSSNDSEAFGYLYQWGRTSDGHQIRSSLTTNVLSNLDKPSNASFIVSPSAPYDWKSTSNNNLWQGVNGINNPCPAGFRIPTSEEWMQEIATWSTKDAKGAFNSPLRLTVGGQRSNDTGALRFTETGYYWTSTIYSPLQTTFRLHFGLNGYGIGSFYRSDGNSCRCIKD